MGLLTSRPALRWLAPIGIVAVIGGTTLVATTATADPQLPEITAEQLLVEVQKARVDGLSGTVVERADLGIPAIPGVGPDDSSTELTSLISGTHTLRVRYASPDKFRLGVHGTYGETDTFVNGRDVWVWSSRERTAVHKTIAGDREKRAGKPEAKPEGREKTPEDVAKRVLGAVTPTTTVSIDSTTRVAGRDAYELVLQPKDSGSLINQVRLAVDGETKLPLRVQVLTRGDRMAFETGYTEVSFTRPADREFVFTPPPGTEVKEESADKQRPDLTPEQRKKLKAEHDRKKAAGDADKAVTKVGTGWTTVAVVKLGDRISADKPDPSNDRGRRGEADQLQQFLQQLPEVSGSWGRGRLLAGTAFSAVLTEDNRLAVGAVEPELLYKALG